MTELSATYNELPDELRDFEQKLRSARPPLPEPDLRDGYRLGRAEDLLGGCLRDRDQLPAGQPADVRFDDFMADEEGTVARIYELAGQPFGVDVRAAMAGFRAAHPRDRYGGISYRPAHLGLDPGEVAERLRLPGAVRRRPGAVAVVERPERASWRGKAGKGVGMTSWR